MSKKLKVLAKEDYLRATDGAVSNRFFIVRADMVSDLVLVTTQRDYKPAGQCFCQVVSGAIDAALPRSRTSGQENGPVSHREYQKYKCGDKMLSLPAGYDDVLAPLATEVRFVQHRIVYFQDGEPFAAVQGWPVLD